MAALHGRGSAHRHEHPQRMVMLESTLPQPMVTSTAIRMVQGAILLALSKTATCTCRIARACGVDLARTSTPLNPPRSLRMLQGPADDTGADRGHLRVPETACSGIVSGSAERELYVRLCLMAWLLFYVDTSAC